MCKLQRCDRIQPDRPGRTANWWLPIVFGFLPVVASAHAPDQSYLFLRVYDDAMSGRVEITVADLNLALGLDLPEDHSVTQSQLNAIRPDLQKYLNQRVAVGLGDEAHPVEIVDVDLYDIPQAQFVRAHFEMTELATRPEFVTVVFDVLFDLRPDHRGFAVIEHNWQSGTFNNEANVSLVFSPGDTRQVLEVDGSVWQGFLAMVGQGAHHIWIGIDHILFLFALMLPAVVRREQGQWVAVDRFQAAFWYAVKVVTVFTIAHTLTLSAAAMGTIRLPSRLVESVIALSIAVAAFDILRPIFKRRIWWIVFAFGLFHGFGFASVLADIGIGGEYLLHTLLGFNLGVELGQIAIVAVIFPLFFLLRRTVFYRRLVLVGGAASLILVSLYWFVERGFEIDLPAGQVLNTIIEAVT